MKNCPAKFAFAPALLAVAVATLGANPAFSQQSAALEEVVVTAQRRQETLKDVGMSVSAFNADALSKAGIDDVSRLELVVPGLNYSFAGNDAKFNVRGANSSNTFGDNSSIVGAFVDGFYKPRASQQTRAFFDVERVEFLRGPQGTLYGRNTFAGALNVYTNKPTTEEVEGSLEVSAESYDRTRSEAMINFPVTDDFAVRFAGVYDKSSGYIDNNAGPNLGAQDDYAFRASALWTPTDSLEIIARYTYAEESGNEAGLFGYTRVCRFTDEFGVTDPFGSQTDCANPVRGSGSEGPAANGPGGDPWEVSQDYVRPIELEDEEFNFTVNWDLGAVTVKSLTAVYDYSNDINFDFDFSPTPNSNGGFLETSEGWSQEINIASNGDGPFAWTAGGYYSDIEDYYSFYIYQQTVRDDSVRPTVITPTFPDGITLLTGTPIVSLDTSLGGFFADSQRIATEYYGVYADGEFSLTDSLRVFAGIRYNDESKNLDCGGSNFTGDTNGDGTVDPVVTVKDGVAGSSPTILPENASDVFSYNCGATDAVVNEGTFDNVTWRAGVEYDITEDVMVYLTGQTGYLSGSVNTTTVTEEQESQVVEVGFKSVLLNDTLQLNGALHFTEYSNLLTQRQREEGGIAVTFSDNGGDIEATGVEFDAIWLVTPNLTVTSTLAWLDAEFGTFGQGNPYQQYRGENVGFIDQSGETPAWSPELTFGFSAGYDINLGSGGTLTPFVQTYYSDGFNTSNLLATDRAQDQDSYTKTDLRLIWSNAEEALTIEAFAENIENADVLARGNNNSDDVVQTAFLMPRNYGLRLRVMF